VNVTILQHDDSLRPGKLSEYLIRRHRAVVSVLKVQDVPDQFEHFAACDLIVSLGSLVSVYRTDIDWVAREHRILSHAITRGVPVLGICFGAQLITALIGGHVAPMRRCSVGWIVNEEVAAPLWTGPWFRFHKEQCHLPATTEVLALSHGVVQAFQYGGAIGLQFHPEIDISIGEDIVPTLEADFAMTRAEIDSVLKDTHAHVDSIAASRDALFDEIFCRYSAL
jgi:GMP synthase-like glutamine amidotransferase